MLVGSVDESFYKDRQSCWYTVEINSNMTLSFTAQKWCVSKVKTYDINYNCIGRFVNVRWRGLGCALWIVLLGCLHSKPVSANRGRIFMNNSLIKGYPGYWNSKLIGLLFVMTRAGVSTTCQQLLHWLKLEALVLAQSRRYFFCSLIFDVWARGCSSVMCATER